MINVLVVEDSPTARVLLVGILQCDPNINVIGTASNGKEALEFLKRKKPDIVTMDVKMPVMDGLEATKIIMETNPLPIVLVSASASKDEVNLTFLAMEAGALAFVGKPRGVTHPDHRKMADNLVRTVKAMSEVKVVRRRPRLRRPIVAPEAPPMTKPAGVSQEIQLVAVGTSTGGPPALQSILSRLLEGFPAPVLIVQHISKDFIQGLTDWLQLTCKLPVHIATHNELLLPGHVYIAPDDYHMGVAFGNRLALSQDPPENGDLRPAVSYLFRSVARVFGSNAAGVLLTGMGKDGAIELKEIRDRGSLTIVQDKESSTVHGMPGEAIKLDAAKFVLPPNDIAVMLTNIVNKKR